MYDSKTKKLRAQPILRKEFNRGASRACILKSIKKNKNQREAYLLYLSTSRPAHKLSCTISRLHNFCEATGHARAYFKKFGLSRHSLKQRAKNGLLQNLRSGS